MRHTRIFEPFRALIPLAIIGLAAAALVSAGHEQRNGCLWDHDTLRFEAMGMPGTIEAITGRFDRFPALYYEMRLERVAGEVGSTPARLELYDDAGVACDRLGRHDEAIGWMARKREQLDRAPDPVHEYRYLANLGTFHVHRWIANGASREDLGDLDAAVDLIRGAISMNPDAHFGRERYQLLTLEWLRALPPRRTYPEGQVPNVFNAATDIPDRAALYYDNQTLAEAGYTDAVAGLTGLVAFGAAWESVDVFKALELALLDQGDSYVAYLARFRVDELLRAGRVSYHPDFTVVRGHTAPVMDGSVSALTAFYEEAREEAETWHEARMAYMAERLEAGQHPDTHPEFWGEWVDVSSPPALPGTASPYRSLFGLVVIGVLLALFVGVVAIVWVGVSSARSSREDDSTKAHA